MKTDIRNTKGLYGEIIGYVDDRGAVYRRTFSNECIGYIKSGPVSYAIGGTSEEFCVYRYHNAFNNQYLGYISKSGGIYNSSGKNIGNIRGDTIYADKKEGFGEEIIGSSSNADIRAGAALLLGLFDGTAEYSLLPDEFYSPTKKESTKPPSEEKPKDGGQEGTGGIGPISSPSGCLETMIATFIGAGVICGLLAGLLKYLSSKGALNYISDTFSLLSKWYVIAIVAGLVVFIVSLINSSGIVIALIEALLAGCCYHFMILLAVPGPVNEIFERIVDERRWIGALIPIIMLSPCIIDSIFLAIGSFRNTRLRESYIIMNYVLFFIAVAIQYLWLVLDIAEGENAWNLTWLMLFAAIFYIISAAVCMLVIRLFLRHKR